MYHLIIYDYGKESLAVNPVNGFGLFQYLESFFENGITYKVYAVADSKEIKTNSGIALTVDDVIANLKGHEDEYDAMVFACGDAVPVFQQNASKQYNIDLMDVIKNFGEKLLLCSSTSPESRKERSSRYIRWLNLPLAKDKLQMRIP